MDYGIFFNDQIKIPTVCHEHHIAHKLRGNAQAGALEVHAFHHVLYDVVWTAYHKVANAHIIIHTVYGERTAPFVAKGNDEVFDFNLFVKTYVPYVVESNYILVRESSHTENIFAVYVENVFVKSHGSAYFMMFSWVF